MKAMTLTILATVGFALTAHAQTDEDLTTKGSYRSRAALEFANALGNNELDCGKNLSFKIVRKSDSSATIKFKSEILTALEQLDIIATSDLYLFSCSFNEGQVGSVLLPRFGFEQSVAAKGDTFEAVVSEMSEGSSVDSHKKVTCTVK